jgi:hypothetical protein
VLEELDMIDNNDTDLNARTSSPNSALDQKIDELISGLYWDAKCGRAAAEYNLEKAGMIEMISGHVAGQVRDGDNFWDDLRWTVTERCRRTSMPDLQRIILCGPPLEIALWDAKDEAADVAGGCGAWARARRSPHLEDRRLKAAVLYLPRDVVPPSRDGSRSLSAATKPWMRVTWLHALIWKWRHLEGRASFWVR